MKVYFKSIIITTVAIFLLQGFKYKSSNESNFILINKKTKNAPVVFVSTQEIIDLANLFKATLTASQLSTLQLSYSYANARTWSNLPASMSPRLGIKMGTLNATQLTAAKNLIQAITGTPLGEGYNEIQGLWAADDYLSVNGGGTTYGNGNFYIAFFGNPAMTGTFEIQMTGHHRTVSNTYINGVLAGATPSFVASEPYASFTSGSITYQPMIEEKTALVNMLSGLTSSQLATAQQSTVFTDILLGPQDDWIFPATKIGLQVNTLNPSQKQLVVNAIETYVNDIDDISAAAIMTQYISEINETYVAFSGTTTLNNQNDYVRIDGPNVWIEYSTQNGIILSPKHPHSVWRDHTKDYGGAGNLSIPSHEIISNITNYPNPVIENTIFNFYLTENASVKIKIYDLSGKLVLTPVSEILNSGSNSVLACLDNLNSGCYIYNIEINGNKSKSHKLIKK